ncbi:hypothetical protein KNU02_gp89 [Gordonia phage Pleakley]|uniref:Uncharacterized protein n=1 Tax=Gordonia phage Pleakley TaxID=2283246 RepID=A0A345M6K7_9CAUD|nr:hypothetical protein KNU02_gp89 [Gordonia phage Pleakley]AXH49814.1 hypothetical protein SEA_FURY_89 [Gordonia phage Fury]AXH66128.1 hypothetical protein SEA_PLEAKLEY_89 [Gordonia phage Pleakley]
MIATNVAERVQTGTLDVEVSAPAVYARGARVTAAGYVWDVLTDDDDTGAPRVRVICHGRRVSAVFNRWQYPRADIYEAVGRAAVGVLTGATSVALAHVPAGPGQSGYVGRVPIADSDRPFTDQHARFFAVLDLI